MPSQETPTLVRASLNTYSHHSHRSLGFSLIELLVTLLIIGILAIVIISVITSSRNKAKDTRIRSSINNVRTVGQLYFDDNNASFVGIDTCFTDPSTDTWRMKVSGTFMISYILLSAA